MDSNYLCCIFHKDPYTREIFEGVVAKDQFMKEHFEKKTYMCVVNEQDSQLPGSHWVMVYQEKKKTYFIDSLGIDLTNYGFKFKRPVYQVSRDYNVQNQNYVELILCFLDADWQEV